MFGGLYGYEENEIENRENEIGELINRIIDKNALGMIQAFADYKNYMSYEIIINNADIKDGKLSKQAGYNSGAGRQIPYTLILSAEASPYPPEILNGLIGIPSLTIMCVHTSRGCGHFSGLPKGSERS